MGRTCSSRGRPRRASTPLATQLENTTSCPSEIMTWLLLASYGSIWGFYLLGSSLLWRLRQWPQHGMGYVASGIYVPHDSGLNTGVARGVLIRGSSAPPQPGTRGPELPVLDCGCFNSGLRGVCWLAAVHVCICT
jgi:hypothetical protein